MLRVPGVYGAPYTFVVTLFEAGTEVMVYGAERAPSASEWRHMVRTMRAAGLTVARFYRVRDGQVEPHTVNLRSASS